MFKNKMYLYGLGVGLIVGAILLQLMNIAMHEPQTYKPAPIDELDPKKLEQQASEYFQVFDKKTKLYTQTEFDNELKKRVQEEKDKLAAASPAPGASPSKRTVVYVQANLPASSVAELLYKSGVVSDRRLLEEELLKQQAAGKIQVGYHVFEGSPDLQQVIKNLQTEQ